MKPIARLVVVAVAPLLMAALWMDKQPSYKPYQAPVLAPPAGSVPVTGREIVSQDSELKNPSAPTAASQARGKSLYTINCTMCHGQTPSEPGAVGIWSITCEPESEFHSGQQINMGGNSREACMARLITIFLILTALFPAATVMGARDSTLKPARNPAGKPVVVASTTQIADFAPQRRSPETG